MPRTVVEKKSDITFANALICCVAAALPFVVLLIIGIFNSDVWNSDYAFFTIVAFGICFYFSFGYGLFSWRSKTTYVVFDIITLVLIVPFSILTLSFCDRIPELIGFRHGVLWEICITAMFYYVLWKAIDSKNDNSYFLKYVLPFLIHIIGLVFTLWLSSFDAGILLVTRPLTLGILLIIFVIMEIRFYVKKKLDIVIVDTFTYEEETEIERLIKEGYLVDGLTPEEVDAREKETICFRFSEAYLEQLWNENRKKYENRMSQVRSQSVRGTHYTDQDIRIFGKEYVKQRLEDVESSTNVHVSCANRDYERINDFIENTLQTMTLEYGTIYDIDIYTGIIKTKKVKEKESEASFFVKILGGRKVYAMTVGTDNAIPFSFDEIRPEFTKHRK